MKRITIDVNRYAVVIRGLRPTALSLSHLLMTSRASICHRADGEIGGRNGETISPTALILPSN